MFDIHARASSSVLTVPLALREIIQTRDFLQLIILQGRHADSAARYLITYRSRIEQSVSFPKIHPAER